MDFLPRELIAQLELYQHSFHETILCLIGTSELWSSPHLSLTSLHLNFAFETGVCVTSNKYVAACAKLTELLSHELARPARRYLALACSTAPCSDQFHLSPASLLPPAPATDIAQPLPVLASHMEHTKWQPKRFLHEKSTQRSNGQIYVASSPLSSRSR